MARLSSHLPPVSFASPPTHVPVPLRELTPPATGLRAGSPQEVEMVLVLLYELGVGISEEAVKPGSGTLGLLVAPLLAACERLPAATHRLVALNLMELAVRYVRLLQQVRRRPALPAHHSPLLPASSARSPRGTRVGEGRSSRLVVLNNPATRYTYT